MITRVWLVAALGFLFLQSCVVPETKETQSDIVSLERKPFVASKFILSKVTKFNANRELLAIETARIDIIKNEIHYFSEDRIKGTFNRQQLKYSDDGLLLNRSSMDRNGQVNWAEGFQHDDKMRVESSIISIMKKNASALHVQYYEYDEDQLLRRTLTASQGAQTIETDEYSYLPTGHLEHRISKRILNGKEISSWSKFEYDATNRISKRTNGEGVSIGTGIVGYEVYGYDSVDNLTLITENDISGNMVSFTNYEYFYAGEPAYNRIQQLFLFNL